ncbi:ribonuclease HII [Ornithinibacillus contaminans]|uniref:ribonuclease HII n=1 Tax=Ornithinibacillus contaminans TaxID=694055 RepID=UPI00064D8F5F|nr:ribonuclease HII [Ornithinibacillus contaminans]
MEKQSITTLRNLLQAGKLTDAQIEAMKKDTRKGVQQLLTTYEKQKIKQVALEKAFVEMCHYERNATASGKRYIAGIDEAGRGPLAGPVVAAAVILPSDFKLLGLNDSKQVSETARDMYFDYIIEHATSYHIAVVDSDVIDQMNILEATKLAMKDALTQLNPPADHVLIDAVELSNLPCSQEAIIKGDAKSISIAAASILAKVTRDRIMKEIHEEYPMYDFKSNMGYGTKFHMERLAEYGVSPYHRKSFAPVRECL